MRLYHWNQQTKEYIGSTRSSHITQGSTTRPPPETAANEIAIWSETDKAWQVRPDFRGQNIFRKTTLESREVDSIGPISDEWTIKDPDEADPDPRRPAWLAFDEQTQSWRIDGRKKTHRLFVDLLTQIESEHDQRIAAGCEYDGLVFGASGEARRLLREIIDANQWPHIWFDRDFTNEYTLQDAAQAAQLLGAMQLFVAPIKEIRYRKVADLTTLRAQNDPDIVAGYDPKAGWPDAAA